MVVLQVFQSFMKSIPCIHFSFSKKLTNKIEGSFILILFYLIPLSIFLIAYIFCQINLLLECKNIYKVINIIIFLRNI